MTRLKIAIAINLLLLFVISNPLFAAKKILVIESYHSEYAWDASYIKGLEKTIGKKYTISYFQMDTKRVPATEYQKRADLAWAEYTSTKPDLVILGDDNALKFLGKKMMATNTPIVYLGINSNPREYLGRDFNKVTGVLEKPLIRRSIPSIKKIVGSNLKKVLILFDSGTTSKAALNHIFKGQMKTTIDRVPLELRFIGKWDEWKNAVSNAEKEGFGAIVIGLYHTIFDENGKHVDADEVLNWTAEHTKIPPFGFWDFSVGKNKTIGGLVLYGEPQGISASEIVDKILEKGIKPEKISPIIGDRGRFLFSRSMLNKFNLKLPVSIEKSAEYTD